MNVDRQRLFAGLALTERRLEVGGVSTTVLEGGDGPPLVLLHGGIECGGAYWGPVVSRLLATHRLVIPDAPGLGESEPVARLGEAFSDWLSALLESTCREKPSLVAHSLLGTLAARHAAQLGDSLRSLVLYAVPGIGPYRLPVGLQMTAIRLDLRPTPRNHERIERWAFLDPEQVRHQDAAWLEAFRSYNLSRAVVPHVKRTMRRLIRTCTRRIPDADLLRIEVPTALLWGRHDRMVPIRTGEAASSTLGWPLHLVDAAGHVPHIERPESFLRALQDALEPSTEREPA